MHASKAALSSLTTLKKRADFVAANQLNTKWVSQGLVIQIVPNDLGLKRVGYTVTKKTDKRAVVRNRIKRRLRAAAADVLPGKAKSGMDYILIGRASTETRDYKQLCKDITWCLGKLNCLEGQDAG
ncbi:MAG: ribonuclease P protein component [Alphaproteobacteria bacterium]|nr:ribonuclease P protein component [Alphaproteobacteria bacterium]MCD8571631.1 ribonuclease P protein component [Alphaproteobacteria bacterium]